VDHEDVIIDENSVEYRRCADPRTYFAGLRSKAPIDTTEGLEGRIQVLTRDAAEPIFRDPMLFSSGVGANYHGAPRPLIPLQIDPPDHIRYRRLLDPVFAPKNVYPLEADVADLTNRLIDRFVDAGRCDFTKDIADQIPSAIFLRILGLPFEQLPEFLALKDGIIRSAGATADERDANKAKTGQAISELFSGVIAERRAEPRDDLVTKLISSEVDGERLTDEELVDICFLLLLAGLDTVSITLQCMIHHLAKHPEGRRELVADLDLVPNVVEELLRWETPVQGLTRVLTGDAEVGGCPFSKGDRVQVILASINTDPGTEPGYERVDFHRENNRHVAFGAGVHRCLGSHLARVELRTVLREWHRRVPDYSIDPAATVRWNGSMLRGFHSLPIVWEVDR
jgi:cytochrome P450